MIHRLLFVALLAPPVFSQFEGGSVLGTVRDATWQWMDEHKYYTPFAKDYWYAYPVVADELLCLSED